MFKYTFSHTFTGEKGEVRTIREIDVFVSKRDSSGNPLYSTSPMRTVLSDGKPVDEKDADFVATDISFTNMTRYLGNEVIFDVSTKEISRILMKLATI